ncbi:MULTISPECIES: hypothetical protein [Staphylococcus]|uniref:hypothetical protein n=1 Tax=Staphylococcus TaxID=1279 RepID=UPI0004A0137D|nr:MULTISPECIES: hypothetical protein [Staphylococcus]KDE96215.1 hypothetical protein CM54_04065 [Staphylococcus sp. TE8]MDM7465224.1 hypothetical protein [Staphylococcus warneri]MDW3946291.1 hypothetical protein [Staphylococcus saprophyticus]MDW4234713.1 hypothetical protein [Staphylococcus saprophyticus]
MNQTINIVPHRDNTIISDKQVPTIEPIYARVAQLSKIYALSQSTVNKYVKEAEASNDFEYIVKRPSPSICIVEIKGFKSFLEARQKKSFQKISK